MEMNPKTLSTPLPFSRLLPLPTPPLETQTFSRLPPLPNLNLHPHRESFDQLILHIFLHLVAWLGFLVKDSISWAGCGGCYIFPRGRMKCGCFRLPTLVLWNLSPLRFSPCVPRGCSWVQLWDPDPSESMTFRGRRFASESDNLVIETSHHLLRVRMMLFYLSDTGQSYLKDRSDGGPFPSFLVAGGSAFGRYKMPTCTLEDWMLRWIPTQ